MSSSGIINNIKILNKEWMIITASDKIISVQSDQDHQWTSTLLPQSHKDIVVDVSFDDDLNYLVSAGDDKCIYLWDLNTLQPINHVKAVKRITSVIIKDSYIYWSDKFGSVFKLSIEHMKQISQGTKIEDDDENILLGHYSSITTMKFSDKFVYTADKDGKIRISHYPDTFDIYGYCLGHESFVSYMLNNICNQSQFILSCGGDSTLRLWDTNSCKLLQELSVYDDDDNIIIYDMAYDNKNTVALISEGRKEVTFIFVSSISPYLSNECTFSLEQPSHAITYHDGQFILSQKDKILVLEKKENKWQENKEYQSMINISLLEVLKGDIPQNNEKKISKEQLRKQFGRKERLKNQKKEKKNE